MAKEYELTAFEAGDFKDQHGNVWGTAVFLGEGEPVKWVVKDPLSIKIGQKYYGSITEEKSKAGKPYLRFRREKVPDGTQNASGGKFDSEGMAWGNALTNATQLVINFQEAGMTLDDATNCVIDTAKQLFEGRHTKDTDVKVEDLPL